MPARTFLLDLGSPYAWLAAERLAREGVDARWQPILLGALFRAAGRSSWARTPAREAGMAGLETRAAELGLGPIRWPDPWPNDGLLAARAATAAASSGAGEAFALAAFRTHFLEGRPLEDRAAVAAAATAAGLDAEALLADAATPGTKAALRAATDAAWAAGAYGVPTLLVEVPGRTLVFWGEDHLDAALAVAA